MISKDTEKLLKLFSKRTSIPDSELKKYNEKSVDTLITKKYIANHFIEYTDNRFAKYSDYYITEDGKAYLYHQKSERRHFIVPLIISIIAAIGGYRQELALLLHSITKLLK